MKKVKQQQEIFFYSYFSTWKILYFVGKHIWKNLIYIVIFVLQLFLVAANWKCIDKKPTPI